MPPALAAANQLERLVIDLETGQRGFVFTGQEQFLQPGGTPGRPSRGNRDVDGYPGERQSVAQDRQRATRLAS